MKIKKKFSLGITGASGFIGSAVFSSLTENNHNVIILDDFVHPLRKRSSNIDIPEDLDWVLHFGNTKSIKKSFQQPMYIYRLNLESTMVALDIALSHGSRFLYMSSYVYGKPTYLPIDENHPVFTLNPYMGSKLLGEQLCMQTHQSLGLSAIVLRGFTLYGPNQKDDQLVPAIINAIKNRQPILINDAKPKRDYLFISDFVKLINLITTSNFSGYAVYNVGGGIMYQNTEVAEMANTLMEYKVPICVLGKTRKNDILECVANIDKVKRDFKWNPTVDLLSGLSKCLSVDEK